jgi:drug/metabolite transporter (DMT)-like permease
MGALPLAAVALVLTSCVLHALWNLLLKRAGDKIAFTALFVGATPLIYLPLFVARLPHAEIPPAGWACAAATGLIYVVYFGGLARAYAAGEMSVVYPLARSVGPALTVLWGILFLGERPTVPGLAGIGLIIAGVAVLQWPARRDASSRGSRTTLAAGAGWALVVGLSYSLYSLVDKVAVGRLGVDPAVYIYLTFAACALLSVPPMAARCGLPALRAEWRASWRPALGVAVLNVLAYLLILVALSLPGAPVSYIIPMRTLSVPVGMALGVSVLGEERRWSRGLAVVMMVLGVALITRRG